LGLWQPTLNREPGVTSFDRKSREPTVDGKSGISPIRWKLGLLATIGRQHRQSFASFIVTIVESEFLIRFERV
jgi:hypothetical protein